MATRDLEFYGVSGADNVAIVLQDEHDNLYRLETTTNSIKFTKNGSDVSIAYGYVVPSGEVLQFEGAAGSVIDFLTDVNSNELLATRAVTSAVNELIISNAATGNPPYISVQGGDTDVGLQLDTKAAGTLTIALGGDEVLRIHDASGMTFSSAADVAGHGVYLQTEDGGADTAADGGVAGGLLHISTGDGGAGGAAQTGGAGGALTIQTGAGGAPASGSASGGAAGVLAITGGAGGAAGASGGTGGHGGDLVLTPGAAGGAGGGTAGSAGWVGIRGTQVRKRTLTTDATAGPLTVTAAMVVGGLLKRDPAGAARTDTFCTGTQLETALGGTLAVGDSVEMLYINTADAAEAVTLAGDTGTTMINAGQTIAQNESAIVVFVRTAANAFDVYVIGA